VVYALKPYFYEDGDSSGAEHGSPYEYDAHVPLLIAGKGVRSGTYATEASPADIAPTLSALLGVEYPAGRQGRVLVEALKFK
jgi:arylsulfatase A-like enzyme